MPKPLKTILCWILICSGCAAPVLYKDTLLLDRAAENPSVELQLLDVHLGTPYAKVKAELKKKYGAPIKSENMPAVADTFKLDPKTDNVLKIVARPGNPSTVDIIFVGGTGPIAGLNFFSNANLGDLEKDIPREFPKAKLEMTGYGLRRYGIPFANYFIDVKNGKVFSLGIWDVGRYQVKAGEDSISLSENLAFIAARKGLLSKPIDMAKIKALASDSLRPYCKERYPLRLAPTGTAYVDVNVYKNEKDPPVPATFLLDTGWSSLTALSPELCKKTSCKYRKPPSSRAELDDPEVSIGGLEFGNTRDTVDLFNLIPREILRHNKFDGILGISTLWVQPLFINFKQGYLCFPTLPPSQVAQKLKFAKVNANQGALEQRAMGFWTDFYVNNQRVKHARLDSGADRTFLSKEDITRLSLRNLSKTIGYSSVSGLSRHPLYGPVEIGWPSFGITQKLRSIAETDNIFSLIGMDFLRYTILSIGLFESGDIYMGQ